MPVCQRQNRGNLVARVNGPQLWNGINTSQSRGNVTAGYNKKWLWTTLLLHHCGHHIALIWRQYIFIDGIVRNTQFFKIHSSQFQPSKCVLQRNNASGFMEIVPHMLLSGRNVFQRKCYGYWLTSDGIADSNIQGVLTLKLKIPSNFCAFCYSVTEFWKTISLLGHPLYLVSFEVDSATKPRIYSFWDAWHTAVFRHRCCIS